MFDAIIVAGGSARRMDGADKPALDVGGRTLLDTAIAAAHGAARIVVVGPRRATATEVDWTREEPPGGGPVAGIEAGLDRVREPYALLLAADLPRIAGAVPLLLSAATNTDVAVLAAGGRRNFLAAVWRTDALRAALDRLESVRGAAVRDLYDQLSVVDVTDEDDWSVDCDTPDDLHAARERAS